MLEDVDGLHAVFVFWFVVTVLDEEVGGGLVVRLRLGEGALVRGVAVECEAVLLLALGLADLDEPLPVDVLVGLDGLVDHHGLVEGPTVVLLLVGPLRLERVQLDAALSGQLTVCSQVVLGLERVVVRLSAVGRREAVEVLALVHVGVAQHPLLLLGALPLRVAPLLRLLPHRQAGPHVLLLLGLLGLVKHLPLLGRETLRGEQFDVLLIGELVLGGTRIRADVLVVGVGHLSELLQQLLLHRRHVVLLGQLDLGHVRQELAQGLAHLHPEVQVVADPEVPPVLPEEARLVRVHPVYVQLPPQRHPRCLVTRPLHPERARRVLNAFVQLRQKQGKDPLYCLQLG